MGTIAKNGIINLMRGDSFTTPIKINLGSKLRPIHYRLGPSDKLYFGLMEPNQAFENAILKKVFDHTSPQDGEGNTLLTLKPLIILFTLSFFNKKNKIAIYPP